MGRRELERVERASEGDLWAVGHVAYEAAPAFDPALATLQPSRGSIPGPLAAFSLFPPPQEVAPPRPGAAGADRVALQPSLGEAAHAHAIAEIREAIAAGETYQVNLTFPLRGGFTGDPEVLFWQLAPASAAPHAAFLDCGATAIVSLSPELFFSRQGDRLVMRPMKGTRRRGRFTAEDDRRAAELAGSPKERAENLMIVDMVRNCLLYTSPSPRD